MEVSNYCYSNTSLDLVLSDFIMSPSYLFVPMQPCEIISILDGKMAQLPSTFTQQALRSEIDHQDPHGKRRAPTPKVIL